MAARSVPILRSAGSGLAKQPVIGGHHGIQGVGRLRLGPVGGAERAAQARIAQQPGQRRDRRGLVAGGYDERPVGGRRLGFWCRRHRSPSPAGRRPSPPAGPAASAQCPTTSRTRRTRPKPFPVCDTYPVKVTRSAMPLFRAACSKPGRSAPSPTITSRRLGTAQAAATRINRPRFFSARSAAQVPTTNSPSFLVKASSALGTGRANRSSSMPLGRLEQPAGRQLPFLERDALQVAGRQHHGFSLHQRDAAQPHTPPQPPDRFLGAEPVFDMDMRQAGADRVAQRPFQRAPIIGDEQIGPDAAKFAREAGTCWTPGRCCLPAEAPVRNRPRATAARRRRSVRSSRRSDAGSRGLVLPARATNRACGPPTANVEKT